MNITLKVNYKNNTHKITGITDQDMFIKQLQIRIKNINYDLFQLRYNKAPISFKQVVNKIYQQNLPFLSVQLRKKSNSSSKIEQIQNNPINDKSLSEVVQQKAQIRLQNIQQKLIIQGLQKQYIQLSQKEKQNIQEIKYGGQQSKQKQDKKQETKHENKLISQKEQNNHHHSLSLQKIKQSSQKYSEYKQNKQKQKVQEGEQRKHRYKPNQVLQILNEKLQKKRRQNYETEYDTKIQIPKIKQTLNKELDSQQGGYESDQQQLANEQQTKKQQIYVKECNKQQTQLQSKKVENRVNKQMKQRQRTGGQIEGQKRQQVQKQQRRQIKRQIRCFNCFQTDNKFNQQLNIKQVDKKKQHKQCQICKNTTYLPVHHPYYLYLKSFINKKLQTNQQLLSTLIRNIQNSLNNYHQNYLP